MFITFMRGAADLAAWCAATLGAFLLRFDGRIPPDMWPSFWMTLGSLICLKLAAVLVFQVQRQSWTKVAFRDARMVLISMGAATVVALVPMAALYGVTGVPATVGLIDGFLTVLFMLGVRGITRMAHESRMSQSASSRKQRNVLLIGAGEAGSLLAREILRHPETGMRPVGFVDDDLGKAGRTIATVPVLGKLNELNAVLDRLEVDEVLITLPSADGRLIRSIMEQIRENHPEVAYRTMPALHELLSGQVTINRIRDVGIDDLLRRPPVQLDTDSILSYLQGKRVMVTGAGGSIGSELVRQICRFHPREIILFGHGENSIYQLERELDRVFPEVRYRSVIAAVQNKVRLEYVFRTYQPEVVFHTAAHKHVPLMELNPEEAVFNNIIGSRNLVDLALKYNVSHFVNISTDKAVNPTSVMGASKRVVEQIIETASREAKEGQTFVSVRFGNVLGSRGSAVPIFKAQIAAGGPVTVTDPDMVRYFMTIPEASRLVLQASAHGHNGEVYILDMGEPVKVLDLVKDLIRLSGLEPEVDIPIKFTGMRPGEKMFEELMTEQESQGRTTHEKIFVARTRPIATETLNRIIVDLTEAAMRSDGEAIRELLSEHIEGSRLTMHDGFLVTRNSGILPN